MFNEKEVRECYQFLNHLNETEIRIVDPKKKLPPQSLFVQSEDEFVEKCKEWNGKYNLYAGINERQSRGTAKQDVISVQTVVIDIDAIRPHPSENPATEEELKASESICNNILAAIEKSSQPSPVKLNSGNGYQLWFAIPKIEIDNFNRQDIEDKLQMFQERVISKFDVNNSIDKIGDLPRIIKIWGTYNIKGIESEGRKFRIARVVGASKRQENELLKKQILEFEREKIPEYESENIDDIDLEVLPPCVNHLLKFYENKDGKYWYRIIQFLSSFFMSIGLQKEKSLKIIYEWNKKQPYHENNEEKEIESTVNRIYSNKINIPNCKKVKNEKGGFPYFGLADLKICKPDGKCNKCINPIIRYKRGIEKKSIDPEMFRGVLDKKDIAEKFRQGNPYFYDKAKIWWFWNKEEKFWEQVDETDLMNSIAKFCLINTINSTEKNEMIEALKQVGRENLPLRTKPTWVQFKDTIVDIITGEKIEASSKYFITNPIPWNLGESENTETMDKIFKEWVGEENVKTLYEILAYCSLPDYPIHRLFCFLGSGSNGKGCFLRLLKKFIGEKNVTSTELDTLINSRFEITRLFKKLVCQMGETNFSELSKTSVIKKLTGQDLIGYEYKNKTPFDDMNYAKILIATNNLPTTTDKTIGFYRRWMIIDFPNQFPEDKDILNEIPENEYNNLALKVMIILKDLLERRNFTNEGSVEDRQKKYEEKSNFFDKFWKENTVEDYDSYITVNEFERKLGIFCKDSRQRMMSPHAIIEKMKEKGIEQGRPYMEWWENDKSVKRAVRAWMGIKWR